MMRSPYCRFSFSNPPPYCLLFPCFAADFARGTLIIDKPGAYRLCEDISFVGPNPPSPNGRPRPSEAFQPDTSSGVYGTKAYMLGFFAAISIVTSEVDIYLDGYTLEQSKEHSLMQRFYANIEIGSSPFISGKGPADFGRFVPASNVRILGPGTIGRASHHGIHGNNAKNIEIRDIRFVDFEIAAVALNNVDNVKIENNKIPRNRQDVPVNGMFSAAHFLT